MILSFWVELIKLFCFSRTRYIRIAANANLVVQFTTQMTMDVLRGFGWRKSSFRIFKFINELLINFRFPSKNLEVLREIQ